MFDTCDSRIDLLFKNDQIFRKKVKQPTKLLEKPNTQVKTAKNPILFT